MKFSELLNKELKVLNVGVAIFKESMESQSAKIVNVDWKPKCGGKKELIDILSTLKDNEKILKANEEAINRLLSSKAFLVDIKQAREVIPALTENMILHAGPPIEFQNMCGPMQGAILGALIYEGKAKNLKEAKELAASGEIKFEPCHHHNTVGPMAGIVSPSMYVYCIKNETYGNYAYCTLNEGLGKVLRFGAYSRDVIKRLKWMENVLAPGLAKALKMKGKIDIKNLIAQALLMGDECHNRNVAGTSLFLKEIAPALLETDLSKKKIKEIINFINSNVHFFLNLSMPAAKSIADTIKGLEFSTIMCAMARNGVNIGIRVAGLGDEWFTAEAGQPKGLYFAGFSEKDANRDLGDSTITETAGFGGFAMAAAPAIVKFIGGVPSDAINFTLEMYNITFAEHKEFQIPNLNFRGTPVGVDICKVVEYQLPPFINTGIAHKKPGIGQVGAGILRANISLFEKALIRFYEKYSGKL